MQANFQLLTGDSAIGGGLQLPVTQSWTADNIVTGIDWRQNTLIRSDLTTIWSDMSDWQWYTDYSAKKWQTDIYFQNTYRKKGDLKAVLTLLALSL